MCTYLERAQTRGWPVKTSSTYNNFTTARAKETNHLEPSQDAVSPIAYDRPPSTPEKAEGIPGYAAFRSNSPNTEGRPGMARRAHIPGVHRENSRLHDLSTWKEAQERTENGAVNARKKMASEVGLREGGDVSASPGASQTAVNQIVQENLGGRGLDIGGLEGDVSMRGARLVKGKGKGKEKVAEVIMYCDFDSYFVFRRSKFRVMPDFVSLPESVVWVSPRLV